MLVAVDKVFQIKGFRFLDQRIDNVHLPAFTDLFPDEIENFPVVRFKYMPGNDGFTTRRHFIDNRSIKVPVKGHGQGPWDGSCGHDQDMGCDYIFFPEFGALRNPEPVLFIDND